MHCKEGNYIDKSKTKYTWLVSLPYRPPTTLFSLGSPNLILDQVPKQYDVMICIYHETVKAIIVSGSVREEAVSQ